MNITQERGNSLLLLGFKQNGSKNKKNGKFNLYTKVDIMLPKESNINPKTVLTVKRLNSTEVEEEKCYISIVKAHYPEIIIVSTVRETTADYIRNIIVNLETGKAIFMDSSLYQFLNRLLKVTKEDSKTTNAIIIIAFKK